MLLQYDTLAAWNDLQSNYTKRMSFIHHQLRVLSLLNDSNCLTPTPDKLHQYQRFLQQISSQKNISTYHNILRRDFCHNDESDAINGVADIIWIVKPIGLSCGEKIQIAHGSRQVLEFAKSFEFKCIIQKYISKPLVVRQDGRKFDIRQWILITSLQPLIIYGFSEFYLRLTSKPFHLDLNSLNDPLMHLCNHAIQKTASPIDVQDSMDQCDTMMTQQEFINELNSTYRDKYGENVFHTLIQPRIRQISIDAVNSVKDRLNRVGEGFEWLGLDLMVSDGLEVKLIEINTSPDISYSTPVTSRLIDNAVPDLFDLLFSLKNNSTSRFLSTNPSRCSYCSDCSSSEVSSASPPPHWCCWHYDEAPYSSLQIGSTKRKKFKLQNKCIPPDIDIHAAIENLEKINHSREEKEGEDDDEL